MSKRKEKLRTILLLSLVFGCATRQKNGEAGLQTKNQIKAAFENWTKAEIRKGNFFAPDSCNMDYYVMKDSLGLKSEFGLGIPQDSTEINIYYAALNRDNKKDALITFVPYQCDGGNATEWVQYQLLVLSENGKYAVKDHYFDKFNTEPGFIHVDSAATRTIFGTYFEFKDDDGRCCPSIEKPIVINLKNNTLKYLKR